MRETERAAPHVLIPWNFHRPVCCTPAETYIYICVYICREREKYIYIYIYIHSIWRRVHVRASATGTEMNIRRTSRKKRVHGTYKAHKIEKKSRRKRREKLCIFLCIQRAFRFPSFHPLVARVNHISVKRNMKFAQVLLFPSIRSVCDKKLCPFNL